MHILEHELEDGRFQYVQVERRENVALYTQTHKASGTVRYEVIKIKIQPEHTWPNGGDHAGEGGVSGIRELGAGWVDLLRARACPAEDGRAAAGHG